MDFVHIDDGNEACNGCDCHATRWTHQMCCLFCFVLYRIWHSRIFVTACRECHKFEISFIIEANKLAVEPFCTCTADHVRWCYWCKPSKSVPLFLLCERMLFRFALLKCFWQFISKMKWDFWWVCVLFLTFSLTKRRHHRWTFGLAVCFFVFIASSSPSS